MQHERDSIRTPPTTLIDRDSDDRTAPRTDSDTTPRPGPDEHDAPETARNPVPDVKHQPEPDAENIMPAQHEPGTL